MKVGAKPTLGHVIAAHLVQKFRNGASKIGVPFDDLAVEVEAQLTDELRETMRIFGTSVERALAWALAPLVETGDAQWEKSSRLVWISPIGLQLLAADANYVTSPNDSLVRRDDALDRTKSPRQPLVGGLRS